MSEQDQKVIDAMETYGGSFAAALSVAFRRADLKNFAKLKAAFPEIWKVYEEMAEEK